MIGVSLVYFTHPGVELGEASRSWPRASGRIEFIAGEFVERPGYRYEVDGTSYTSTRLSATEEYMDNEIDRYPPGSLVQVRYNPNEPQMSVLETGNGRWSLARYYGGFCVAIFAIVMGVAGIFYDFPEREDPDDWSE